MQFEAPDTLFSWRRNRDATHFNQVIALVVSAYLEFTRQQIHKIIASILSNRRRGIRPRRRRSGERRVRSIQRFFV
jgi:hypothetical protein